MTSHIGSNLKSGQNDLLSVMPDLAKEWHFEKNKALTPADVCVKSNRLVWWKIIEERFGKTFVLEWQATVANRTNGNGCPYTSKPPKRLMKGFNDLASTNPNIASLWHPEKNNSIYPDMIFEFTNREYWWMHQVQKNGKTFLHECQTRPHSVTENSCPICHGIKVITHPDIAKQWGSSNNALCIQDITEGSNKEVSWLCNDCGNKWKATVNNRTSGSGFPKCAFRYSTSFPEQAIYYYLKKPFSNCINRDTDVLNALELDIYLPDEKITIEYNGLWSRDSKQKQKTDEQTIQMCHEKGILLIRVCEHKLLTEHNPSVHLIHCKENKYYSHLDFVMLCISKELMNVGCLQQPINANIELHHQDIRAQYVQTVKDRSLAKKFPDLLFEWDYEKNGHLTPDNITFGSSKKIWWKHTIIKRGEGHVHTWQATVNSRTRGNGCPICDGKIIVPGFNDLATTHAKLLQEWDYSKNEVKPTDISYGYDKKV